MLPTKLYKAHKTGVTTFDLFTCKDGYGGCYMYNHNGVVCYTFVHVESINTDYYLTRRDAIVVELKKGVNYKLGIMLAEIDQSVKI